MAIDNILRKLYGNIFKVYDGVNSEDKTSAASANTAKILNDTKVAKTGDTLTGELAGTTFKSNGTTAASGYKLANGTDIFAVPSATANKWTTARTVTLAGDVAGSVSVDGSENITLQTSILGANEGMIPFSTGTGVEWDFQIKNIYICETTAEVTAAKALLVPNNATIYNSWKPVSQYKDYYRGLDGSPTSLVGTSVVNELTAWNFDTASQSINNTTNSSGAVARVSTDAYDTYTIEATLTSTNNDDDSIGIVAAYTLDEYGYENILGVWRSPGGNLPLWGIRHNLGVSARPPATLTNYELIWNGTQYVKWGNGKYGNSMAESGFVNNTPGWSGLTGGTKIKITRNKHLITVETTDFNSASYVNAAKTTINLTSSPTLLKYNKPCSIGVCAYSQEASKWSNLSIDSPSNYVYNIANGTVEKYNTSTSKWIAVTDATLLSLLPKGRILYNQASKKRFYIGESGTVIKIG